MKKKFLKLQKIAAWTVVFVELFYFAGFPYLANAVSLPAASFATLGTAEDLQALANQQQAQGMTADQLRAQATANKKINGPQVKVLFDSQNVQSGQRLTAEAKTTGFTKGDDSLYFTWFLKHKGCGLGDDVDAGSYCDPDGDSKVTVNDWKVEAMRIVARGEFDSKTASYSGSKDEKSDGYETFFGGESTNGADADKAACYFQDFTTGRTFELAKIKPRFTCATGALQCVKDEKNSSYLKTDPADPSQPPLAPTLPLVPEIEKNICRSSSEAADLDNLKCELKDIDIFETEPVCASGFQAVCMPTNGMLNVSDATTTVGRIFPKTYADNADCNNSASICKSIGIGKAGNTCTDLFSAIGAAQAAATEDGLIDPNKDVLASCDYEKDDGAVCKHLFPKPETGRTGDGKFTLEEEKFWGTNPKDPKTAENQNFDETNVVGFGINKFSWEYRSDDQLGVVVEGTFTKETQHDDATKMVMWALPNNICSAFKDKADNKGFYVDDGNNAKILAVDFDIDECLEENLLDPSGNGSLQVDLTYSPSENLVNDPEGGNFGLGSILNVSANVSDFAQASGSVVSANSFYYNWKIEVTNSSIIPPINSDPWLDVTAKVKNVNPGLQLAGLGFNKLELPLNLPDDIFVKKTDPTQYIRIKTEVSQLQDGGDGLKGKGTVIIKINQLDTAKGIKMFPVSVQSDGKLTLLDGKRELCSDQAGRYMCDVTENEIVGLTASRNKLSNHSWSLNGNPLICSADMSGQCANGNVVFFPATVTEDGFIKVTLNALDVETKSSVKVDRYFKIVAPAIMIDSADYGTLKPKLFGFYKDIDGGRVPDYSDTVYETAGNGILRLKALFYPQWKADQASTQWFVNGAPQEEWNGKSELEIDPAGMEEISVDLNVAYSPGLESQVNNIRKALWKYWQISPTDAVEENNSASIRIEVAADNGAVVASGNKKWFGAMLTSHVAAEAMFTIRLFLTTLVIIFVTGLVFAIMPGEYAPEEER